MKQPEVLHFTLHFILYCAKAHATSMPSTGQV